MSQVVTLDGVDYRVTPRVGQRPLIYKRYATGVYFRWSLIWGDDHRQKHRSRTPAIGSQVARVLAAVEHI